MTDPIPDVLCGLLGFAAGIFAALSVVERPVWRVMLDPASKRVSDDSARAVHAILKRVIHPLSPIMTGTVSTVTALVVVQVVTTSGADAALIVAGVFFVQFAFVFRRPFGAVRRVVTTPSDDYPWRVREGLAALAREHHLAFAMMATTLVAQWTLLG